MQTINGDVIIVVAGTVLLRCIFGFVFFFVIAYNNRYRKNEAEKAEIIKRLNVEKLQSQVEIQEQTFKNISGEIHDNIGQILSLVGLQLSTIATTDEEKLDNTIDLLDKAIQDLRDLSKSLDTDRVDVIGIVEAVKHDLLLLEKTGKYKTSFTIETDYTPLPSNKRIIFYRIIQEVINNIIKHAKADTVSVRIHGDELVDLVTIADNGIGFVQDKLKEKGLGLSNIASRAALIGGQVTIDSVLNQGTSITFALPKINKNV
jgi:signal transduction histidine kinase